MSETEATTVQAVVGANVKRIREERGGTIDELVRVARLHGIRWSKARVMELHAGKLAISASLLLALPHVLGTVTRSNVTLADLLTSQDDFALTPELVVKPAGVGRLAGGGHAPYRGSEVAGASVAAGAVASLMLAGRVVAAGGDFSETVAASGIADHQAAARAGMALDEWLSWAHKTWGTSLTAERDRRTGSSSAVRRGHVTRQLEAEVAAAIAESAPRA